MNNPVSLLKDRHRQLTFDLLSRRKEISRVEIARELNVSLQTGMKIMSYFTDYGLAVSMGGVGTQVGRKPQMYAFNPNAAHVIAAVNEGSVLRVCVLNLACEILAQETADLRGNIRSVIVEQPCEIAQNLLNNLEKEGRKPEKLLGAAMCLPGVVDEENRTISFAPSFVEGSSYKIGDLLDEASRCLGVSVIAENDVNAAVYGEYAGCGNPDLAFISIGSGVGMGLVLDGKLRRGPMFTAGEIGMMPYFDAQAQGNLRTVEELISLDALKKRFGFDRRFGVQAMNPKMREVMIGSVSDAVVFIVWAGASMLGLTDFVLGGITADLLGEDLFEAVRKKASQRIPLPVSVLRQTLVYPEIVGAAKKIIDANKRDLLAMDD
ncbi:MAG: ROK family protein [Clostridiales bacterium]|jgi:predicted NBD/HSP70 family sugar kinase|nr:ROK family protein [Clostridiales bacterium]